MDLFFKTLSINWTSSWPCHDYITNQILPNSRCYREYYIQCSYHLLCSYYTILSYGHSRTRSNLVWAHYWIRILHNPLMLFRCDFNCSKKKTSNRPRPSFFFISLGLSAMHAFFTHRCRSGEPRYLWGRNAMHAQIDGLVSTVWPMWMKWNENKSGLIRPPLCTYRLNWARRTSWGWWDDWDDTVLQTQDSKFEPWRSEAEHATSRSRRLPTILTFTRGWGRNIICFFQTAETGNRTPNSGVKGSGANH